jgi:subtilase family serine protease
MIVEIAINPLPADSTGSRPAVASRTGPDRACLHIQADTRTMASSEIPDTKGQVRNGGAAEVYASGPVHRRGREDGDRVVPPITDVTREILRMKAKSSVTTIGTPRTPGSGGAGPRMRPAGRPALAALVTAVLLAAACMSGAPQPQRNPAVFIPAASSGEVTFYLALPSSPAALAEAAVNVSTPGSPNYRRFVALDAAASQFGATDAQITTVADAIKGRSLNFSVDPTRLFARVSGSIDQWTAALGAPLAQHPGNASHPFTTYTLPRQLPAALQPAGTAVLLPTTQVYDPSIGGSPPPNTPPPTPGTVPLPLNTGTPPPTNCSAPLLQQRRVYTPPQIQTAYGIDRLRAAASGTPAITILDLGGGWLPGDLNLAAECFGYPAPPIAQTQGDGVVTAIAKASGETSLDLQTVAAVAPAARLRLVQTTAGSGGVLDGFSRALGEPGGPPDVVSLSYGRCLVAENEAAPTYLAVADSVLAMTALIGVSSFVAAGDSGSTTCGSHTPGTSLSYPAVSPFVTAVGGTRLALSPANTRTSETVWNDSVYGAKAAGGGAVGHRTPRPAFQNGANDAQYRAIPDVSALADIVPGWPVVINSTLQTVGGTSGSTPLTAASTALVAGSERHAGRPPLGLANGWFYTAAVSNSSTFYDITEGNNDLAAVGCCTAAVGYDPASGLGAPNWATLPATLPAPS